MNLDDLDPVRFGEELSKLPPTHPLVAASRLACDVSDRREALRAAGHDVAGGWRADGGATDARRMWEGRAETDGPGSRAAEKAAELAAAPPPQQRAEDEAATEAAVRWARRWAAEQAEAREADDRAAEQACARHAQQAAERDTARNRSSDASYYHADTREMTHA